MIQQSKTCVWRVKINQRPGSIVKIKAVDKSKTSSYDRDRQRTDERRPLSFLLQPAAISLSFSSPTCRRRRRLPAHLTSAAPSSSSRSRSPPQFGLTPPRPLRSSADADAGEVRPSLIVPAIYPASGAQLPAPHRRPCLCSLAPVAVGVQILHRSSRRIDEIVLLQLPPKLSRQRSRYSSTALTATHNGTSMQQERRCVDWGVPAP